MTPRTEAPASGRLLLGVLLTTIALIGLVVLGSGCATGLRTSISAATTAIEEAGAATDALCMQYAEQWCATNPCADLERCKRAYKALLEAGVATTEAGRLLNGVIK